MAGVVPSSQFARPIPATGRANFGILFKIQTHLPAPPSPQQSPALLAAGVPVPGKGLVNGLNDFLFPKPRDGQPVLPPKIPPEATASALTALRLALGPAKFYKLLKIAFGVAVGGTIPEALVGLGVTETVQPAKEVADAVKSLFLPHRPVETNNNVFTSEASRAVNRGVQAIQRELDLYLDEPKTPGGSFAVGFERGTNVTNALLDLIVGEQPEPRFNLRVGDLAAAIAEAAALSNQQWASAQAAAGVGTGSGSLKPLPPERGDP